MWNEMGRWGRVLWHNARQKNCSTQDAPKLGRITGKRGRGTGDVHVPRMSGPLPERGWIRTAKEG